MKLGHTPMSTGHWYWSKWLTSPPSSLVVQAQLNKTAVPIFFEWPFSIVAGFVFPMPPASTALRVLSLTLFQSTIRYSCFSVLDGQDFHLRHHHVQKDASICPPSWLVCIIACLSLFIADAKSLQMPHHFLFSVPVIFQPFFPPCLYYYYLPRAGTLWKRPVCASARHTAI